MFDSRVGWNPNLREIFKIIYIDLDHITPESQRSKKQDKATDTEKHMWVSPHTQAVQFLWQWKQQPPPCINPLPKKTWRESFSLIGSPSNFFAFWPEKNQKEKLQANITFKDGRAMLFSLPRQDLQVFFLTLWYLILFSFIISI